MAGRRSRRDREALPRPRWRGREHGPSRSDDQALASRTRGRGSSAVRSGDTCGSAARDGRARTLSGARQRAHRIAVEPVIDGLLRDGLGFHGVVVTDSMEARASLATGSITAVSERAVGAGADLLLLTGKGSYAPVYRHLLEVARRSSAFRARVREAAARVLALKARGALPPRWRRPRAGRADTNPYPHPHTTPHPPSPLLPELHPTTPPPPPPPTRPPTPPPSLLPPSPPPHAEIAQEPVLEPVDDPVDGEVLATRPGVLDDRGLADVQRPARRRSARTGDPAGGLSGSDASSSACFSARPGRAGASCRSGRGDSSSAALTPPQP